MELILFSRLISNLFTNGLCLVSIVFIIDFSNVYINKNHLENTLDDVIYLIRNNKEDNINNILDKNTKYSISVKDNYATVTLEEKINFL